MSKDEQPPSPRVDDLAEQLCRDVDEAFESEQVPWLRRLVEQPSHTWARDDVEAAASMIDERAEALELRCRRVPDESGRFADHRVYESAGTGPQTRALALVGHVDTVFPRSMGFLAFTRDETGDVIRGPGVLDMKSGLSAVLFALRAARRVVGDRVHRMPLRFVCNTDEEVGSPSSAALFEALAPLTTEALVFEGGRDEDRVITQRKGGATFTIRVRGRAAHAGNDHASGVNAIHVLSLLVPRLEALTDYARGVTVNVGLIAGGTAKNTVPDEAHCTIDARFERAVDAEAVTRALQAMVDDPLPANLAAVSRLREAEVALEGGITRPPMEATEATQALRRRYERFAARVGLGVGEAPRQGGGSDANILAGQGVPVIDGLGPFGRFFHKPQEWSSLGSLRRKTQALALFLADAATCLEGRSSPTMQGARDE
jgi:glutamate carboxypeptidase